jgi:hypothetical protein
MDCMPGQTNLASAHQRAAIKDPSHQRHIKELPGEARKVLEAYAYAGYHDTSLGLGARDLKYVVGASFMLVRLANGEGDVAATTSHYETAMRHYATFPAPLQESIRGVKGVADLMMVGTRRRGRIKSDPAEPEESGIPLAILTTPLLGLPVFLLVWKKSSMLVAYLSGEVPDAAAVAANGRNRG